MSRRTLVFCAFALAAAALFVRLGLWQVSRLHERQARNAEVAAQQRATPMPFASLPADSGAAHYRPASLEGRYDYEHELVLASRTHQGSPGVELITPVRRTGSDTAVLVNRGWVYSPDGGSVDLARWHEGDSARVTGYVEVLSADAGVTASATGPRIVRRVSRQEIQSRIPYAVDSRFLVQTGENALKTNPARREVPPLDDGPHRSYAIQWFAFAAIALGGAAAVVLRERQGRERGPRL